MRLRRGLDVPDGGGASSDARAGPAVPHAGRRGAGRRRRRVDRRSPRCAGRGCPAIDLARSALRGGGARVRVGGGPRGGRAQAPGERSPGRRGRSLMFGIGTGELLLLLVIALIVLGPERMPKLARDLGRALAEFRKTSDELRTEFLNADKYLDAVATSTPPAITAPQGAPETGLTEAAVATDAPAEPDEAGF